MVKIISKKYRKQEIESEKKINNSSSNHTKLVDIKIVNDTTSEPISEPVSDIKETKKTKSSETKKNENTKQDE